MQTERRVATNPQNKPTDLIGLRFRRRLAATIGVKVKYNNYTSAHT